jgi:hypothetical protein
MASTTYDVAIEYVAALSPESEGFIDPKKVEHYMVDGPAPTNVAASITKERANIRYDMMIGSLGLMGNVYISNVVATDADVDTPASLLEFVLVSEHGDECLVTADEENEGDFLTGADAIKRVIARVLISSRTDFGDYYDPTEKAAFIADASTVNAVRVGTRIASVAVVAAADNLGDAESVVTVTLV